MNVVYVHIQLFIKYICIQKLALDFSTLIQDLRTLFLSVRPSIRRTFFTEMEFSCQHSTLSLRVCDSLLVFTIFQQGDLDLHKWKMLLSVKIDIFIDTYVGEIMTYLRKIMTQFEQRRGTIFIFKIRQMFERLI